MRNQNVPAPAPTPSPMPVPDMPIYMDPVALIKGVLDCYQNITIAKEEQLTQRIAIREQSRIYLAQIEADAKKFELGLEQVKIERMTFVNLICNTIQQEGVDEYTLKLCEYMLNYLACTNPMNNIGKIF